jgi:3-carboxy-cis,cis-muconate cycloisomerase
MHHTDRMSDLLWPGASRAADLMSDASVLDAMVRVESAWLGALVDHEVAELPGDTVDLSALVTADDLASLAEESEGGGNPVIPLVALLRARLAERSPAAARWVHRGLTSQDVLDTALQLAVRDVVDRLRSELGAQVVTLAGLADEYRATVMAGRTLTQYAVPITFGLKAAQWLQGILDAAAATARVGGELCAQIGGAAGTLSAATVLAGQAGLSEPDQVAVALATDTARTLGLRHRPPWPTSRGPVTRIGDALVACTDAWGRVAGDVLTLGRPEIGELSEPAAPGRGGSSAMPQKANPVLSVLIHRAALSAPALSAQLHLAAAESHDERPDGAWHTEWATLQTLCRRAVVAAAQATELLAGLQVHPDRMAANALAAADELLAEGRGLSDDDDEGRERLTEPSDYLGASGLLIDAVLQQARDSAGGQG